MIDPADLDDAALIEAFFQAEDAEHEELAQRLADEIERSNLDF